MGHRTHLMTSEAGIRHDWEDNQDGTYTIHASQDVEASLEANKAMATHNDGYSPSREWRRAAHIPSIVLLMWRQELGGKDPLHPENRAWLMRRLDDPDYAYLRTAPGRLGRPQRQI